jgi:hypothetical protein
LTALFLWTLQSTNGDPHPGPLPLGEGEGDESNDDDDEAASRKKVKGFNLVYDVARRFAQPLGIHMPDWEGRIIETEKGIVRLLRVLERATQLFGDEGASAVADELEHSKPGAAQLTLFPREAEREVQPIKARARRRVQGQGAGLSDAALTTRREATTLDRVHAAMLLQAGGRTNALHALLEAEIQRGPDFLRLANALSALYPKDSEEKRLLDAMLLAVPRR